MKNITFSYGITAITLLLSALFVSGSIDIAFHDTYIVVANSHLMIAISFLYILFYLGALVADRRPTKWVVISSWTHYLITTLGLLVLVLLLHSTPEQQNYKDYSVFNEFRYQDTVAYLYVVIVIAVVTVQFTWIFNGIRGAISRIRK